MGCNCSTESAIASSSPVLADFLAQGRGAFEARHYSEQEFLDREYDYKLDFFLQGNQWKYVQLSISILDWSKRIQRVDF